MKSLFLLALALTASALANVITIGHGIEKNGKKYYLQFPDCATAFYAGDNFSVEAINLRLDWQTRYEQSRKFKTPMIRGFVQIKDETKLVQTDLSAQIEILKRGEASSNRKLYSKCTHVPVIKLLSSEKVEVEMIKDEYGSVKLTSSGGKMFMAIDLNPLIPEHNQFLFKLLNHKSSHIQLKLSSLQEIASCRMQSSYEAIHRFEDVVYYDQECKKTKVCKKFWFVTECWEEYKCTHIPHKKRVFLESQIKDEISLELTSRPATEDNIRDHLMDQCLDGFIASNFMAVKNQRYAEGSQIRMDTLLKEHRDQYSFQTSVIEAYPNKINLALNMNEKARTQIELVYTHDRFDCFKEEETIWLPENHYCIKEISK